MAFDLYNGLADGEASKTDFSFIGQPMEDARTTSFSLAAF